MYKGRFAEDDFLGYVETDPTGRYVRLEEILGRGAMKTVYKAIDELVGMEVAWSQIKLNDVIQTSEDLQRLHSEVHLLGTLHHHSIITFYSSWIDVERRTFNFITEMFTSGTLREYRKKYKQVDIHAIKIWACQILAGLVYLHGHDPPVIHRDLKCDNIFVNGHLGQVKIGDLGLATILRGSHRAHSVIGTPEFMAPELYDENYNELVDIYSFGMCVLEMLTGEYPYSECTNPAQIYKKVTAGKKPRVFYKVQDLAVQRFIGKCLEPVSKRLSAQELMADSFLAIDDFIAKPITMVGCQKSFLNDDIGFEELNLNEGAAPRTNMTITGKLNPEDDTIFLKVQIADNEGDIRNVYFPFDILSDNATDVASEMVKELEITDWKQAEIANMIDGEITGLVPPWKDQYESRDNYKDNDNEHHHNPYRSFSSCLSFPGRETIGISQGHRRLQDEWYEDTSSEGTACSCNYSCLNYFSCDENDHSSQRKQTQPTVAVMHNNIHSSTERSQAQPCKDYVPETTNRALRSRDKCTEEMRVLTRNRSLVDMRSQLLHRTLVEEVSKRRLFKTVGAVENVGFEAPYEGSRKSSISSKVTTASFPC